MKYVLSAIVGIVAGFALGVCVCALSESANAAGPTLTGAMTKDANLIGIQNYNTATLYDGALKSAAISNLALTSNVVTITTSAAHGYAVGQRVTVAMLTGPALFADANGTFVITVVGSTTTFSYALTHANITTGAATGTSKSSQLSPTITGTSEITLVFPPGAAGLSVIPMDATDATWSYTSGGGIGGTFPLYQNQLNYIPGIENSVVYIQRTTTTKIAFVFGTMRQQ